MNTYQMDWDFFNQVQRDDALARVTAYISGVDAYGAIDEFLETLETDSNGVHGRGGWAVYDVTDESIEGDDLGDNAALQIVAGGQDVATAIEDGTWEIARFAEDYGYEIEWETEVG